MLIHTVTLYPATAKTTHTAHSFDIRRTCFA